MICSYPISICRPQKLKHRHEYSLPPEVYTPEQYSILEENSPFKKPPLPKRDNGDAVLNLQQILSDVETWDSVKFCEKWSSKISEVKEGVVLFYYWMSLKYFYSTTKSVAGSLL